MEPIRLQKALAAAGIASRRAAELLIQQGRVAVDGETVTRMGIMITPGTASITVDGKPVALEQPPLTVMLNKPAGYLCSANRAQGKTVFSLLTAIPQRLFSIGRLDKQSEGLLLLTNDGQLAQQLTHPRYGHAKRYRVTVAGPVTPATLQRLREPMVIDGQPIQPVQIQHAPQPQTGRESTLEFILREGRNRQIRKMCERTGLRIERLCRVQIGGLKLGSLAPGRYRPLSGTEQALLTAPLHAND